MFTHISTYCYSSILLLLLQCHRGVGHLFTVYFADETKFTCAVDINLSSTVNRQVRFAIAWCQTASFILRRDVAVCTCIDAHVHVYLMVRPCIHQMSVWSHSEMGERAGRAYRVRDAVRDAGLAGHLWGWWRCWGSAARLHERHSAGKQRRN